MRRRRELRRDGFDGMLGGNYDCRRPSICGRDGYSYEVKRSGMARLRALEREELSEEGRRRLALGDRRPIGSLTAGSERITNGDRSMNLYKDALEESLEL